MLRALDTMYFRLKDAWRVVKGEDAILKAYSEGIVEGMEIANARVISELDSRDPYQFENQHFKLGYYYAKEQVKKVMNLDEDNAVD
jgi:hypothetical protein